MVKPDFKENIDSIEKLKVIIISWVVSLRLMNCLADSKTGLFPEVCGGWEARVGVREGLEMPRRPETCLLLDNF